MLCFQEAQLNEVLSASNLDPSALTMVTRKLEVGTTHTELLALFHFIVCTVSDEKPVGGSGYILATNCS